jgi:hypothetical protein
MIKFNNLKSTKVLFFLLFTVASVNALIGQLPQLRSVDCFRTGIGLTQALYANPTGAVGYRFEFTNVQLGQTVTLDKASRSITINEFPTIARYNCNYQVRVAVNTGSGFGSFGNICTINSAPLISILRSGDCGKNLSEISSPVYSNVNPVSYPNTDYWDFEVRRADDYSISEQVLNRPNHEFRLTMTSNPLLQFLGTTYEVRIRTSQNGILQPWGGWCSITTPIGGPAITYGCGVTLQYLSYENITCTSISGATQYEFLLREGSTLLGTKLKTVNSIRMDEFVNGSNVPLYNYGSTYRMAARALVNGVWTGWGSLCFVYTTAQPHAEVMDQCGTTIAAFTTKLRFHAVANASYQYELTDLTAGAYNNGVQTLTLGTRLVSLNQFLNWSWGHQYSIRCRLTFKGVTYPYSTACTINAPNAVAGLRSADCPKTLTSSGQAVYSIIMTQDKPVDVTAYQYKIGASESAWKTGAAGRQVTLQEILGVAPTPNTIYSVQVRVMHEGIAQNWGWACSVRTPSAIGLNDDVIVDLDNIDTKSLIEIYPNPVDDNSNFVIQLTDENSENYKLYLLNMSGQVIQDFELSEENRAIETKITAPPGVYFLKVFKGDVFVETRKVIKT